MVAIQLATDELLHLRADSNPYVFIDIGARWMVLSAIMMKPVVRQCVRTPFEEVRGHTLRFLPFNACLGNQGWRRAFLIAFPVVMEICNNREGKVHNR